VPPGAPQEMDGLDKICSTQRYGNAARVFADFGLVFDVEANIEPYRKLRNTICAHIDTASNLGPLVADLQTLDIDDIGFKYAKLEDLFRAACHAERFLQFLALPPTKIRGAIAMSPQPPKAFDASSVPKTSFEPAGGNINDDEVYARNVQLAQIDDDKFEDARDFFWQAFMLSKNVADVELGGTRIPFRHAHEYFLRQLKSDQQTETKIVLLRLMNGCKGGYPQQLEWILLESFGANRNNATLVMNYLFQFGEVAGANRPNLLSIIRTAVGSPLFLVRYFALLAIMKIDVRTNGIICINARKAPVENEYSRFVKDYVGTLRGVEKVVMLTLLTSELLFNPALATFHEKYRPIYFEPFDRAFKESIGTLGVELGETFGSDKMELLSLLKERNLLTGVLLIIAECFPQQSDKAQWLYVLIADNILRINHDFELFLEDIAYAHYKRKNYEGCERILIGLTKKNPAKLSHYIKLLQVYCDAGLRDKFSDLEDKIRRSFTLTAQDSATLKELEETLRSEEGTA
jgi:hypothetical protein